LQDQSGSWFNLRPCTTGTTDCLDYYGEWNTTSQSYDVYPETLVRESRAAGAEPVFFMNWRQLVAPINATTQGEVAAAYNNVAGLTNAMCAPFGNAMLLSFEQFGNASYAGDVIHPSLLTQYTNACVMYATLTNQTPVGLGDAGTGLGSTYNITQLQVNAWTAYTAWRTAELATCNATHCVQFVNSNGTLLPLPTFPPTVGGPPAPNVRRCAFPFNATNIRLVGSEILPSAVFPQVGLTQQLGQVCSAGWVPCYSSTTNGWSAAAFASGCSNRGPTFVLVRSTAHRIFGGLAPVSWGGLTNQAGHGGWLFRLQAGGGAAQFVNLAVPYQPGASIMYNDPQACIWLGRWNDLYLAPDCSSGQSIPYSGDTECYTGATCTNCSSTPNCYNSSWLAGADAFNSSVVEVFYAPELSLRSQCQPPSFQCPSGACIDVSMLCDSYQDCYDGSDERNCDPITSTLSPATVAPVTTAPTSVAPITLAPQTFAPTTLAATPTSLAPSTVTPTSLAPVTVAPVTRGPTTDTPNVVTFYPTLQPPSSAPTDAPSSRHPTTFRFPTVGPPTHAQPTARPTAFPTRTTAAPVSQAPATAAPTTVAPTLVGRVELVVLFPGTLSSVSDVDRSAIQTTVATIATHDAGLDTGSIVHLVFEGRASGFQVVVRFTANISAAVVQRVARSISTTPISVRGTRSTSATVRSVTTGTPTGTPGAASGSGSSSSTPITLVIGVVVACVMIVVVGIAVYHKKAGASTRIRLPTNDASAAYRQFDNQSYEQPIQSSDV
jgi:hypothetical protein